MKKLLVSILVFSFIACKKEGKKDEVENVNTEVEKVINETKEIKTYPVVDIKLDDLNVIFDNGYEFAEDLKLDMITLDHKGGDKYQMVYFMESETDFEKLEELKVSAVFYANDPNQFNDEIYKKRKSRQIPMHCKINTLGGENVVVQNFELLPKEFSQVKFYFYNDEGVVNKKMLTIKNINLPK
jgi:orotidine-5'-phosphate decarboxylase